MENKKKDSRFLMNKKGQGLSVQTIILIILGVVVLVILILGFTVGWNRMKGWIAPINNVDDIADQCSIACSLDREYGFCSETRTLKARDLTGGKVDTTCRELATKAEYSKYGIDDCPGLCEVETETCTELEGILTPRADGCGSKQEILSSDTDNINVCCK